MPPLYFLLVLLPTICAYPSTNCYYQKTGPSLTECAFGYGGGMTAYPVTGGSTPYVVTSNADSGVGTLRDALSQSGRYITFAKSMTIVLTSGSLRPKSHTTIDARDRAVVVTGKSMRILSVENIIVANIAFVNLANYPCKCSDCDRPKDTEYDDECADAVNVASSSRLWFVHCTFANARDGLLDMKQATHHVTVSHCKFERHDKTMLIGSGDKDVQDKAIRVTIAYNYFLGTGQRTPRVRFGIAHIYNNVYESWLSYVIGGSAAPTIVSEGNFFIAGSRKVTSTMMDSNPGTVLISRHDRLINGAQPLTKTGSQSIQITDYEYPVLETDDRRRGLIVRVAGVNVPAGVVAAASSIDASVFTGEIDVPTRGSTCASNLISRTDSSMEALDAAASSYNLAWSCTGMIGTGATSISSASGRSSLMLRTSLTSTPARCMLNITGLSTATQYALYGYVRLVSGMVTATATSTLAEPLTSENDTSVVVDTTPAAPARAWFGVRNGAHVRITSTSRVFEKRRLDLLTPSTVASGHRVAVTLDVVLDAGQSSTLFLDDVALIPIASLSTPGCAAWDDVNEDGSVIDHKSDDAQVTLVQDVGSVITTESSINPYYTTAAPAAGDTNAAQAIASSSWFLLLVASLSLLYCM